MSNTTFSGSCPSHDELSDVLSGRSDIDADRITGHLEICERCAQFAQTTSHTDHLTRMIRNRGTTDFTQQTQVQALVNRVQQILTQQSVATVDPAQLPTLADPGSIPPFEADQDALSVLIPTEQLGVLGLLGQYQVLKLLGRGGMGVVFLADDSQLQRQVALKVLLPNRLDDPKQRTRFLREARAAAGVRHENVVTVYQVDSFDGPLGPTPYLAMELLEGETLERAIHGGRKFAYEEIVRIGEQIAAGLAAAHARGLIHRDIKPANVFLEAVGHWGSSVENQESEIRHEFSPEFPAPIVKLLDFGLALPLDSRDGRLTQEGYLIGTPAYMSPEQASCLPLDVRSDLFSLGSLLYHLATGQLPFQGNTLTLQLVALVNCEPRPVQELNPSLPEPLPQLIMQLLSLTPSERPKSAVEVRDRLRTMIRTAEALRVTQTVSESSTEAKVSRTKVAKPSRTTADKPQRMTRMKTWTAALVGALMLCSGVVIVIQRKDGTSTRIEDADAVSVTINGVKHPVVVKSPPQHDPVSEKTVKLTERDNVDQVLRRLRELNPTFRNEPTLEWNGKQLLGLDLGYTGIVDAAPLNDLKELYWLKIRSSDQGQVGLTDLQFLQNLKLRRLDIERQAKISDITPLASMPLEELLCWGTYFSFEPLRKCPLTKLHCGGMKETYDFTPLQQSSLTHLVISDSLFWDLNQLRGMKLQRLECLSCQVTDLKPLAGMPLTFLNCYNNPIETLDPIAELQDLEWLNVGRSKVKSLAPLVGLTKLRQLIISDTLVEDLSPLLKLPDLESLLCDLKTPEQYRILRQLPNLRLLNNKLAADVLKE